MRSLEGNRVIQTVIEKLMGCLGKNHLEVLFKEQTSWEKSLKYTSEEIHFLVKLQDVGFALFSCKL